MDSKSSSSHTLAYRAGSRPGLTFFAVLAGLLALLFIRSFHPSYVHFSNDGPLGASSASFNRMPGAFVSIWQDLNSIGNSGGSNPLGLTGLIFWSLGPVYFAKFYAPLTLLILGSCAWFAFRQWKLAPIACALGALAATLNCDFFSVSCWGVGTQSISVGMVFLALGLLKGPEGVSNWLRVPLAGLAVGLVVTEGADVGTIWSMVLAAFVMYSALVTQEGPLVKRAAVGVGQLALVTAFAGLMAAQTVTTLIRTQFQGAGAAEGGTHSKWERWDWATQWSFPKREALGLVVPGLFGYRMDTPDGGSYWGAAGSDPNWDRYFQAAEGGKLQPGNIVALSFPGVASLNTTQRVGPDGKITLTGGGQIKADGLTTSELEKDLLTLYGSKLADKQVNVTVQPVGGLLRYSGGGAYAGVLVVMLALYAGLQSLRKKDSVFSASDLRLLWFWGVLAVISLLLAFGRFAPFYQGLFALPYFSNIRNPAKFLNFFSFALAVMFAYGVDALSRRCMASLSGGGTARTSSFAGWWAKANAFDRGWVKGCAIALGISLAGWFIYAKSHASIEQYLAKLHIEENQAREIAEYSINQVGWFVLFFVLGAGLVALILSGKFAGPRAKWGGLLLGLLVVFDLGRADQHWIKHWNYEEKYATNPVIEMLRQQPYEHRVAFMPFSTPPQYERLSQLYTLEWAQHHFQYYNIQSLDIVQMPRMPADLEAFEGAMRGDGTTNTAYLIARKWELTNTRYLLGAAGLVNFANQLLDPAQQRFKIAARFSVDVKPGVAVPKALEDFTAVMAPDGMYGVLEFDGALPRAKLYMNWQSSTNDQAALAQLRSKEFDPAKTVLVAEALPSGSGTNSGQVKFVSYAPKDIVLQADAPSAAVLLLNDRFDPNWRVLVDGKPETLLRCNYIMRGVQLAPGQHRVEFRFEPPVKGLYVSLVAVGVGVALLVGLVVGKRRENGESKLENGKAGQQKAESGQGTKGQGERKTKAETLKR